MVLSGKNQTCLVCQLENELKVSNPEETKVTHTPLACLNEATQKEFALILIRFSPHLVSSRGEAIELCSCLKTNPLTRQSIIVVSMDRAHRETILCIQKIGVRFMSVSSSAKTISLGELILAVEQLDARFRTNHILSKLCPYIHYTPITDNCELITCQAYGNQMVLGGKRLREICESPDHHYCEYYLNSEIKDDVSQSNRKASPGNPGANRVSTAHRVGNVPVEVADFN